MGAAGKPVLTMARTMTVSVTDAAQLLGLSRSTGYQLARDGGIPTVRLGRRLVVPLVPLLELVGMTLEQWEALDAPYESASASG